MRRGRLKEWASFLADLPGSAFGPLEEGGFLL